METIYTVHNVNLRNLLESGNALVLQSNELGTLYKLSNGQEFVELCDGTVITSDEDINSPEGSIFN